MSDSAVPEGFHTITPYLVIKNAAAAIEFYKKAFGAEEVFRVEGPDGKLLIHAEVRVGDSIIMLCDEFPDAGGKSPQRLGGTPVSLHIYVNNVDKLWERATAAGARVIMPLTNMFWGDRYGKLADPYGHHWSLGQHLEDVAPEELKRRAKAAMAKKKVAVAVV